MKDGDEDVKLGWENLEKDTGESWGAGICIWSTRWVGQAVVKDGDEDEVGVGREE